MIENPQPLWLPFLLLALPGIVFAACWLNKAIFPGSDRPLCTIPALGIVVALLPTHLIALAFGSLSVGLTVGWSLAGVVGYAWISRYRRDFLSASWNGRADCAHKLAVAALATMPIILPTILLNFHDEPFHDAIIAHLQNGIYPPRYLYEPSLPLRYHYGFDLAAAIATGLLRVRLDHAIDLLSLALWPCMFLLLWRVGEHFGGKQAGLSAALAVCFSGGWPALCTTGWSPQAIAGRLLEMCTVGSLPINPPFVSYFFQRPWALGLQIFCLVLLQRAALPRLKKQWFGLAALVCSLSLLSLSEAVLFVATAIALGITEAWNLIRYRDTAAARVLWGLGASLLIAKLIGGFFVSGPYPTAGGIFGTGFDLRSFYSFDAVLVQLRWNFASFGALLFLGAAGLFRARRDKLFLAIFAGLTLVIVNSMRYQYSWDIIKFGTVTFVTLAIGAGIALSELIRWARTRGRQLVCGLIAVLLFAHGALYPFVTLLAYNPAEDRPRFSIRHFSVQMIRPYFSTEYPVDRDDARAVSYLRTHMAPSEIVYRAEEKSEPYAIWGGLPTPMFAYPTESENNDVYGLGEWKFTARRNLSVISEDWFDRLNAEHVAWIVTDPGDAAINAILQGRKGRLRAVLAARYGQVRVFRIE